MATEASFLVSLCLLNIITLNGQIYHQDIGCNYVNIGGISLPTDYCMRFDKTNASVTLYVAFQCNDAFNGIDLNFFTSSDCTDLMYSEEFTSSLVGFDCNKEYQSVSCPEVSLLAYDEDTCAGDDYSEFRFIVDQCFNINNNESIYSKLSCTTDSATISFYDPPDGIYDYECSEQYFVNKTVLKEGQMEGFDAGCIAVDGCYEGGYYIPRVDIGCNYINLGDGIPLPTDHCMQIDVKGQIMHVKWICNSAWNGIELQAYTTSDCTDKPFYTEDFTSLLHGFECSPDYKYKVCNEVSLNGYPTEKCEGDEYSSLIFITDACVPVLTNDSLTLFGEMTCTEDTVTYSVYDIPIDDYGNCNDIYLINRSNITEGGLDNEFAQCIDVNGCGDYKHDIVDIGCNYINFDGFGLPTDRCMTAKTDKSNYSFKIYCNDLWDGVIFGMWGYNNECNGSPLKTKDLTEGFPFVCNENYRYNSCNTITLTGYLGKNCDSNEYYELSFITDVCLYDDVDDYIKVNCDGNGGTLSIYETVDGTCDDNNLVNSKSLSSFEFMDNVFGCVDVDNCDNAVSKTTAKPISGTTTTKSITGATTKPISVVTSINELFSSTISSTASVRDKKNSSNEDKGSTVMIMVGIGSAVGACILLIAVFLLIKYCKQRREVKNMDVTHTGQLVKNPYGQIDSIHDVDLTVQ